MRYIVTTKVLSGHRETYSFWAPDSGGYVYLESEHRPCQLGQQICDRLEGQGDCLTAPAGELATVIRKELRRRRDADRRRLDTDRRR